MNTNHSIFQLSSREAVLPSTIRRWRRRRTAADLAYVAFWLVLAVVLLLWVVPMKRGLEEAGCTAPFGASFSP